MGGASQRSSAPLLRYVGAASAYTVVHKLPSLWDGAVEGRNGRPRRMLAGENIGALVLSLALGPVLAPAWLLDVVNRLDVFMLGHNAQEDYGYSQKTCIYRHVLE